MVKPGTVVAFNKEKNFTHIKSLGGGGTGDAHLLKDETTDMLFAFKKYAPKDPDYIDEYYKRFVDEIKILFALSHPNIVRVYNYFLYPEYKLGYLQMEYINGVSIDEFDPIWKDWPEIFTETISAFEYLESNNVLHRDIRPANIMIDEDDNVKIIDFGFSKKLVGEDKDGRSVLLNWPVTELPNETNFEGIYNHQSEIYFVGKLFSKILDKDLDDFKFKHIIDKMIQLDPRDRYNKFQEVSLDISKGVLAISFTKEEKDIYKKFAVVLSEYIVNHSSTYKPVNDPNIIINRLSSLIRKSSLESYLQDNSQLIDCFINNSYKYIPRKDIPVSTVSDFYSFIRNLSKDKQKIVIDNIHMRLSNIKIKIDIDDDDLPF